jgi:SAM-dependent methyltransferase
MLVTMRPISTRRHASALRKEMAFWQRPDILEGQAFRFRRYTPPVLAAAHRYGLGRIANVLEVGCGPTCVADQIDAGRKWYLDPLLNDYERLFPGQLPSGEWLPIAIEDAELENAFFDFILMLNVLDHLRNPWLALEKTHIALKPGGVFVLACYTRPVVSAFLRNLQESLHCSTDRAHPFSFTRARVEHDLRRTGFTIESAQVLERSKIRSEILWTCSKSAHKKPVRFAG